MVEFKENQLYLGDNIEVLKDFPSNCIDLVVTSPPYDDMRTYEDEIAWNFDIFKNLAFQLVRVLKEGGVIVWVVGDQTKDGSESLTSFKQALYFKETLGMKVHDTMIYIKNGGLHKGSNKAYQQKFEYMFVFVKGEIKTYNLIRDKRNKYIYHNLNHLKRNADGSLSRENYNNSVFSVRNNYWMYSTGGVTDFGNTHPAIFPEKLAEDHIISWSNENDIVLDPFMGSGTTCSMAVKNSRKYIGIEKVPKYFEIAKDRIQKTEIKHNQLEIYKEDW